MIKKRKLKKQLTIFGKKIVFSSFILFVAIICFVAIGGAIYAVAIIKQLPSPDQFSVQRINQSTKIYDREGETLLYEIHGEEKRTIIKFDEIPDIIKKTTLVAEDVNFYTQPAFNWKGILRAFYTNIKQGRMSQGGSTITQQLVKNVFLTPEKTITRKLKELILAIEMESKYSKDEIFFSYLNQIPYGSNAYGIEAASQTYFGKSARDLKLQEAAVLASLLKAPTFYSPWGSHVKELMERKNYILDRMRELGFASKEDVEKAKSAEIIFATQSIGSIRAPHFSLMVKEYLVNKYGEELVNNGGLRVKTTLNWRFQEIAEKSVSDGAKINTEQYGSKNAALVAQDPKTGQILALVGSQDYFDIENEGNFNVASQGLRQPGSALKPFVYMTAFQKGYTPNTVVFDVPTEFDLRNEPKYSYKPENFDGRTNGPVMLENALAQSLNIPAVKVLYLAGINDSLKNLHNFGISTLRETWKYGLSLVLGGGEVKLIDLVNAYGTLSQDGIHHEQVLVLKVEDAEGNVLEEYHDKTESVIDPQYPRMISQILSSPELRYPIFGSSINYTVFQDYEVALKTGTSEDHKDAWTVGYTPFIVVGVWSGNNDNTPMIRQGSSILAAVPIWSSFVGNVIKKYEPEFFVKPEPTPTPLKPMLNGQYIWKPAIQNKIYPQVHSILYYVNKEDPLGDRPENPNNDQQFKNWEDSVKTWGMQNIPEFYKYNQQVSSDVFFVENQNVQKVLEKNEIVITITKPKKGEFITSPFSIQANIRSEKELKRVEFYMNNKLIQALGIYGTSYNYSYSLSNKLESQNLLELRVFDDFGNSTSSSIVVYSND